jgi:hypothetical protein
MLQFLWHKKKFVFSLIVAQIDKGVHIRPQRTVFFRHEQKVSILALRYNKAATITTERNIYETIEI